MKKNLLLILLALLPSFALSKTIWSGSQPIDWNNGKFLQLQASAVQDAAVGSCLTFHITFTGGTDWPQIALSNGSWQTLAGAANTAVSEGMTEVRYYITRKMLDDMSDGIVVSGIGFTLTSVDLTAGGPVTDDAVWIGQTVLKNDWSVYQSIPASCFSDVKEGNLLRLRYQDLRVGATLNLMYATTTSWQQLPDVQLSAVDGVMAQYTVTMDMASTLKEHGLIVQGCGLTLSSVEVVDASAVKALTMDVPVVHGWVWENDEQPTIQLDLHNNNDAEVTASCLLRVTTDSLTDAQDYTRDVAVPSGETATVTFTPAVTAPGIYRCQVLVNDQLARAFNIGIRPTEIVSASDAQPDFIAFWQAAKDELARTDMAATFTKHEGKSTAKRNVYQVELSSLPDYNGHDSKVRCYYAEPTAPGVHPAIIRYQGYDSGGYDPWCPGGDDLPDYCELIVSTRGQYISNRAPYANDYGDWFAYGFDSKDHFYYRGAYMDAVRAVDFMLSRDKVDASRLYAEGASQGGALTYAAAALSGKLTAIAPAIPFMGDFPDYVHVGSWPASVIRAQEKDLGMTEQEALTMLSYFDTKNLATLITCPVIETIGLQDNVCPPHTNLAPYNNLPSQVEKEISYNAELKHQTPSDWTTTYMAFFQKYVGTSGIATHKVSDTSRHAYYNLNGQRVRAPRKGVYILDGRKVVIR